jgi:hypothetical protein
MKTKDKYKKSLSRRLPDPTPTTPPRAAGQKTAADSSTSRPLNSSTPKFNERSGNVYENKVRGQKVKELRSAKPSEDLNPRVAARKTAAAPPRLLNSSTCRSQNRGNKARMSMKTNSREVEKSRSREVEKPNLEVRPADSDGLSLFNSELSTSRLDFDGTKRECL